MNNWNENIILIQTFDSTLTKNLTKKVYLSMENPESQYDTEMNRLKKKKYDLIVLWNLITLYETEVTIMDENEFIEVQKIADPSFALEKIIEVYSYYIRNKTIILENLEKLEVVIKKVNNNMVICKKFIEEQEKQKNKKI